jgi:hypothetical protein
MSADFVHIFSPGSKEFNVLATRPFFLTIETCTLHSPAVAFGCVGLKSWRLLPQGI